MRNDHRLSQRLYSGGKKPAKHTQIKKQPPKPPNTSATSQLQEGAGRDSEAPCLREGDNGYSHDLGEMC